jgi:hypothetical protein
LDSHNIVDRESGITRKRIVIKTEICGCKVGYCAKIRFEHWPVILEVVRTGQHEKRGVALAGDVRQPPCLFQRIVRDRDDQRSIPIQVIGHRPDDGLALGDAQACRFRQAPPHCDSIDTAHEIVEHAAETVEVKPAILKRGRDRRKDARQARFRLLRRTLDAGA